MCSVLVALSADARQDDAVVHGYTNAMNVMDNISPLLSRSSLRYLPLYMIYMPDMKLNPDE